MNITVKPTKISLTSIDFFLLNQDFCILILYFCIGEKVEICGDVYGIETELEPMRFMETLIYHSLEADPNDINPSVGFEDINYYFNKETKKYIYS